MDKKSKELVKKYKRLKQKLYLLEIQPTDTDVISKMHNDGICPSEEKS